MGGGGSSGGGGGSSAAPTAGGHSKDYSAQWADYYRSIGKIEEAEAIENRMKVR